MRAARFRSPGVPLTIDEVPIPVPGPGGALVQVKAAGLCGSDLHILEGHTLTAAPPITLGHEIGGIVAGVGSATDAVSPGDRVFVNPMIGCGHCAACLAEDASSCADRRTIGIHLDGGLAEYVVAPISNLTVFPESVSFGEIAIVESAGTANRAVRLVDAGPGRRIVIFGVGGLGIQAVRLAVARGAEVTTVDLDPVARRRSLDAGAVASFDSAGQLAAASGPGRFDGAIDCVGIPATVESALLSLAHSGACAIIGIGSTAVSLTPPGHFVRGALRVFGVYGYAQRDIAEVAARVIDGSLDLAPSISATVPLNAVNEGLRLFADRVGSPTRVIVTI